MNDPKLRIVGGIDSADAIERNERIAKIDELFSEECIDLKALAHELGQFGADADTHDESQQRISLMITQEQKQQLIILGYTEQMIRNMTPTQAHSILRLR